MNEENRRRYSLTKLQRKAEFRAQVLEAYGNQCAVCRCGIIQVLQAAHLHGYEVADTDLSADKVEHGICLCANHHLMYDNNLIDLNLSEKTVHFTGTDTIELPQYERISNNVCRLVVEKRR